MHAGKLLGIVKDSFTTITEFRKIMMKREKAVKPEFSVGKIS